jgi:Uma2 family endonuclease
MATQPKHPLTPEEYLVRERLAPTKSEYYRGEVFAMAGASERHNLIVTNLVLSLGTSLRGRNCRVYSSDMRVLVCDRCKGLYMRIPSLHEYLTVSQTEMMIDDSVRQADNSWLMRELVPANGNVSIRCLGIELDFAGVYDQVEFDEPTA